MSQSDKRKRRRAVSRSTARLTVPQTERVEAVDSSLHAKHGGIIRDDINQVNLSDIEDKAIAVDPTKVVIVIAVFALIFIAIITWFIANEPPRQ